MAERNDYSEYSGLEIKKVILITLVILIVGWVCLAVVLFFNHPTKDKKDAILESVTVFAAVVSPFLSVLAVIVTYAAFHIQYQANVQIREQNQLEKAHNEFRQMISMLKSTEESFRYEGFKQGENPFNVIYQSFKTAYIEYFNVHKKIENEVKHFGRPQEIIRLAYTIVFYGKKAIQEAWSLGTALDNADVNQPTKIKLVGSLPEAMYPGYSHILGLYFRQLFQIARFISQQKLWSFEEKLQRAKELRSQLSSHQQALLYFNSIFMSSSHLVDGFQINPQNPWWSEPNTLPEDKKHLNGFDINYLIDFQLIKNFPLNLNLGNPTVPETFEKATEFVRVWLIEHRGLSESDAEVKHKEYFEWLGG